MDYITKRLSILKQSIQSRSESPGSILRSCLEHITGSLEYTESLPFPLRINVPKTDRVIIKYASIDTANEMTAELKRLVHDLNLDYVQISVISLSTSGPYEITIAVDMALVP